MVIQMLHQQMSAPLWYPVMLLCVKQFVGVCTLQLMCQKCDQVTACLMTNSAIWVTIMLCQVTSAARTDKLRSHSCSGIHKLFLWPTHSNPKIIGVCLLGDNTAGAWMLPLTRMWCVESYFRHSLRLHGLVLLHREDGTFNYFCARWGILRSWWSLVWTLKI